MAALAELRSLVQPTTLAHERVLPVGSPLDGLFPGGGLARGATVRVEESTSLALALIAEATRSGSWVAVVGTAAIGWAAAADLGVELRRLLVIPRLARATWAEVVAALVDNMAAVVVRPAVPVPERDARRIAARARERAAVLIVDGPARCWPIEADVVMGVSGHWSGLGAGHGRLQSRRVAVSLSGRRAANRHRTVEVWLPGADGSLHTVPTGRPVAVVR